MNDVQLLLGSIGVLAVAALLTWLILWIKNRRTRAFLKRIKDGGLIAMTPSERALQEQVAMRYGLEVEFTHELVRQFGARDALDPYRSGVFGTKESAEVTEMYERALAMKKKDLEALERERRANEEEAIASILRETEHGR